MRTSSKKIIALAAIPALGLGWLAFRPELALVNKSVNESAPAASATSQALAEGKFESYAHETVGQAQILKVNGDSILRLSGFKTSNGPDVHVLLTMSGDPKTFDEKASIDLGVIKGNVGDQNYKLPAGFRADDYRAVTIWCKRFNVSFGGAKLMTLNPTASSSTRFQLAGSEIRVTSGALSTGGSAGLYESNGGRVLRLTGKLPAATEVYLVKAETVGRTTDFNALAKVKVGSWKTGPRTQQFSVSKELDAWLYRSVIAWNPKTSSIVATANLRSDQEISKKVSLI